MPNSDSRERLIVALDTDDVASAKALVKKLSPVVRFYKIGLGLLATGGLEMAACLKKDGHRVFLDLKLFDIASTIERTVRTLTKHPAPDFLTVHGDPTVVAAAARGRGAASTRILAVTILTSLRRSDLDEMLLVEGSLEELVLARAHRALGAGADGLIASPHEVAKLRKLPVANGKLLVTPGIRLAAGDEHDQARVATPDMAMKAGADHIVIGRPVLSTANPVALCEEILASLP